jgi:hypothetical protein
LQSNVMDMKDIALLQTLQLKLNLRVGRLRKREQPYSRQQGITPPMNGT